MNIPSFVPEGEIALPGFMNKPSEKLKFKTKQCTTYKNYIKYGVVVLIVVVGMYLFSKTKKKVIVAVPTPVTQTSKQKFPHYETLPPPIQTKMKSTVSEQPPTPEVEIVEEKTNKEYEKLFNPQPFSDSSFSFIDDVNPEMDSDVETSTHFAPPLRPAFNFK